MSIFVSRRRELLLWAVMTLFCGVTGPFGSFVFLEWNSRFLYWGLQIGAAMMIGGLIELLSANFFANMKSLHRDMISACVMTVLFSPVVFIMNKWFFPKELMTFLTPVIVVIGVLMMSGLVIGIWRYANNLNEIAGARLDIPKLLQRLDQDLGPIYALTAKSHLVEVACEQGLQTIRLRFSDAVDEMKPVEGIMVHRSHWVCRSCVQGFHYDGKKLMIEMKNGTTYPVSASGRVNISRLGIDVPLPD